MGAYINLNEARSEEVVRKSCLTQYQKDLSRLRDEITYLHSNVSLVTQLSDFDVEFFQAPKAIIRYLANRLFTDSVLIVTRVWGDRSKGMFGLPKMAAWLIKSAVKDAHRDAVKEAIELATPKAELLESIDRMRGVRNARLAHVARNPPEPKSATPVALSDVQSAAQGLAQYYGAMAFGVDTRFVLVQFNRPTGAWYEGDLGYVLEQIALGSKWFEIPEKHPELWPKYRDQLDGERLDALNLIRQRRRLPPLG